MDKEKGRSHYASNVHFIATPFCSSSHLLLSLSNLSRRQRKRSSNGEEGRSRVEEQNGGKPSEKKTESIPYSSKQNTTQQNGPQSLPMSKEDEKRGILRHRNPQQPFTRNIRKDTYILTRTRTDYREEKRKGEERQAVEAEAEAKTSKTERENIWYWQSFFWSFLVFFLFFVCTELLKLFELPSSEGPTKSKEQTVEEEKNNPQYTHTHTHMYSFHENLQNPVRKATREKLVWRNREGLAFLAFLLVDCFFVAKGVTII
jgi:hypothetical protein